MGLLWRELESLQREVDLDGGRMLRSASIHQQHTHAHAHRGIRHHCSDYPCAQSIQHTDAGTAEFRR
jgi:hypothetical protein